MEDNINNREKKDEITLTLRVDKKIKDLIKKASKKEDRSNSWIMRKCLEFALVDKDFFNLNHIQNE